MAPENITAQIPEDEGKNPTLATALIARSAGISVIPIKTDGTKATPIPWSEFQSRRAPEEKIEEWFDDAGLGLACVCGEVSGGLEFLDFETEEAYEDFEDAAIKAGLGALLRRVEGGYWESAPGGGFHLAYRCSDIQGVQKLARTKTDDSGAKTLIETRGDGAYCIVAPSNGDVHPSGNPYVLLSGGVDSIVTITPEERQDLLNVARSFDELPPPQRVAHGRGASGGTGNRPGDDYDRRASWDDVLEPQGWQRVSERDGIADWRRPGKDEGTSATTNHGGLDLLYVFSSSTAFEVGQWYTKFAAYTLLNHGGDFTAAAKHLLTEGYGSADLSAPASVEAVFTSSGFEDLTRESTTDEIGQALRQLSRQCPRDDRLQCELVRSEAKRRLRQLRVQGGQKIVDAAFKQEDQSSELFGPEPQPWSEPVQGAALLDALVTVLHRYVVLPDGAAEAIALWVTLTYVFLSAEILAILAIVSPTMRCGKTTLLALIGALACRALPACSITSAALFRTVERFQAHTPAG